MEKIKIVQIGMGPLGQKITKYISERENFEIVGAVDKDPVKTGRNLGELCSVKNLNVVISNSLEFVMKNNKPDVAVLATVSNIEKIVPQIEEIASFGLPIVSTCEELSYPWQTSPVLSKKIDTLAKKNNIAVIGTGVNPGFLMDSFPIFLTAICQRVDKIKILRIQNAAFRRISFQKKIGAGLSLTEFERKRQEGTLRHVGLTESINMIADRMGWKLNKIEDILTPVVAKKRIVTNMMKIEPGYAAGVQQIGKGYVNNEEKITLIFCASVGEAQSEDTIEIFGEPNFTSTVKGGIDGDIATCAIIINTIRNVMKASPGLKTMVDIPIVSYFAK